MISARNGVEVAVMRLHSYNRRPTVKAYIPHGCLFEPLKMGSRITNSHPMDDEEGYKRFLKDELSAACTDILPDVPAYKQRVVQMMNYTIPSFSTCWTFVPELIYKMLTPTERQTKDNLRKSRILRACVEMKFSYVSILDDILDGSDMRMGKPTWKSVCPDGKSTAIFDAVLLEILPYLLVHEYFRRSPGCDIIQKSMANATVDVIAGEWLDMTGRKNLTNMMRRSSEQINLIKTGTYFAFQSTMGAVHAGIQDEQLLRSAERIFYEMGTMVQSWDDFSDYYCTPSQTGKPSCDHLNAGTTWASTAALKHFTREQRALFEECYGSQEPSRIETVRRLYDSVDLPNLYIQHLKDQSRLCANLIGDLNHSGMKNACKSWLNWLVGDILET